MLQEYSLTLASDASVLRISSSSSLLPYPTRPDMTIARVLKVILTRWVEDVSLLIAEITGTTEYGVEQAKARSTSYKLSAKSAL